MGSLWRRLRLLLHRERLERELEEEMRIHLEMKAGETGDPASARREFGNLTRLKEESREIWGWPAVESFVKDLTHAWRALRRTPVFTVTAVLTLAAGLGANVAMFSVLRAVLLRPLPYQDPDRLVMVWKTRNRTLDDSQFTRPQRSTPRLDELSRWRDLTRSLESLAGYAPPYLNMTGGGSSERVAALLITSSFFPTLGVTSERGRNFLREEEQPGRGRSVILSDALWRTRFGANPAILGKTTTLDGASYTIVGVLPANFDPLLLTVSRRFDLYLPMEFGKGGSLTPPSRVLGRMRPGLSLAAVQSEFEAITAGLRRQDPPGWSYTGVQVVPLADAMTADSRPALRVLAGAVACVLLIVCANLASLMLARATARRREMGIRAALGAGRWRLIRQILAESLLLGAAGGLLGLGLARWIVELIRTLHLDGLPRIEQAALDAVVCGFGLAISVITGLAFGALPAVAVSRARLDIALRQGGPRHGSGRGRLRAVLVGAEVALALVLATGAGLLLRSFVLLRAVEPGFATDRVLTIQLGFPENIYDETRRGAYLTQAVERTQSIPSVEAAGAASWLPLSIDVLRAADVHVKGHRTEIINTAGVTPGYFRAVGIPLVAGRFLREGERNVFLVNEVFCKRYGLDATRVIGERIMLDGKPRTVTGVVRDIRDLDLKRAAEPTAFLPYADAPTPYVGLAVRTSADPKSIASRVRAELRAIDPELAVSDVQTMEEILSAAVARPRFNLTLLGAFAALAMALAALGVYGTIAYFVSQRRNEIGLRMALGASRPAVVRHTLARGMTPVVAGLALGIPGAWAAGRLLRTMLYGLGPDDPATFVFAIFLLALVALGACLIPARRAAKIDPMEALRHE